MTDLAKHDLNKKKIMIVCGESSGDLHGANLVKELYKKDKNLFLFGIGGKLMRREGFSAFFKSEALSFMGITDVIKNHKIISKAKKICEFAIKDMKPDLLVLIDYPGFNLRLAKFAKKKGVKVLYYISPKIWAWNLKRIKKIKAFTDHVALILPFEKDLYDSNGISSTFVGNPLVDYDIPKKEVRVFDEIKRSPTIGLLPGSRPGEVKRLLKSLLESAVLISDDFETSDFIVSFACDEEKDFFYSTIKDYSDLINIRVEDKSVYNIFKESDFLIAASGTVTLEAAISGIPMIIIYKVSAMTYHVGKMLVNTPYIGLASIIAGKEVIPELIQEDCDPEKIKSCVNYYLKEEDIYKKMVKDLNDVKDMLGKKGVSKRTALIAMDMIEN